MQKVRMGRLAAVLVALAALGCGTDETAPGTPTTQAPLPDLVFVNDTTATVGTPEVVRLRGSARDNVQVLEVALSFANGSDPWITAQLQGASVTSVQWSAAIPATLLPAGAHTLVIRVKDGEGNQTLTSGHGLQVVVGSAPSALASALGGASAGDAVYLSSGRGYAYGDSSSTAAIPTTVDLTIVGAGCQGGVTLGGYAGKVGSQGTLLEVAQGAARLFSLGAGLALSEVRIKGGGVAVDLADASAATVLEIENCLFEGQRFWAVQAVDTADAGSLSVSVTGTVFDVAYGNSDPGLGRGGLRLEGVDYLLSDTLVRGGYATLNEVGLHLEGGAGSIEGCVFDLNSMAILASASYPVLDSCSVTGGRSPSAGIDFSAGDGAPALRRCTVGNFDGADSFAVRVGGSVDPVFYRNVIGGTYKDNGAVGVLVDGDGAVPDLGTWPFDESGYNRFVSAGLTGDLDYVVYVADATANADRIMAGHNFWGSAPAFDPTYANIHAYKVRDRTDSGSAAGVYLGGTTNYTLPDLWDGVSP